MTSNKNDDQHIYLSYNAIYKTILHLPPYPRPRMSEWSLSNSLRSSELYEKMSVTATKALFDMPRKPNDTDTSSSEKDPHMEYSKQGTHHGGVVGYAIDINQPFHPLHKSAGSTCYQ